MKNLPKQNSSSLTLISLATATLIGLAGGLTGCGQRGPLYMPQDASKGKAPQQTLPAKNDPGVQNAPGNDSKPRPPSY